MRRDAGLGAGLDAVQPVVEHGVDHARDRTRAVGRRGAAGHHIDALDRRERDAVEVELTDEAAAVEQVQRPRETERAEIAAGRADGVEPRVETRIDRGAELRDVGEHLADILSACLAKLGFADHRHRSRRLESRPIDQRPGDDDDFLRDAGRGFGLGLCGSAGRRGCGLGGRRRSVRRGGRLIRCRGGLRCRGRRPGSGGRRRITAWRRIGCRLRDARSAPHLRCRGGRSRSHAQRRRRVPDRLGCRGRYLDEDQTHTTSQGRYSCHLPAPVRQEGEYRRMVIRLISSRAGR